MASHLIARVCAIAATIGICSIATFAEPISMSAKPNTVSGTAVRSQPDSAFLLNVQSTKSLGEDIKSQSGTSFLVGANMPHYAGSFDKTRTALSITPGVPEPSAVVLLGSGLLAALGYRSKRKLAKSK
jgi:hypothetical protein